MGFLVDPDGGPAAGGARADLHGLLLPALLRVADAPPDDDAVIDGFEAAWGFFGGVFATVMPENGQRERLFFRLLCPSALCGRPATSALARRG